jgi:hypothetical protein
MNMMFKEKNAAKVGISFEPNLRKRPKKTAKKCNYSQRDATPQGWHPF